MPYSVVFTSVNDIEQWLRVESVGLALVVGIIAAAALTALVIVLRGTQGAERVEALRALAEFVRALWFGRGGKSGRDKS